MSGSLTSWFFGTRKLRFFFYENMRAKKDYKLCKIRENSLDKREKLLAISFNFGVPGATNELINKLCVDQSCSLSKEGIFQILCELLPASPDNNKKEINRGIKDKIRK